MVSELALVRVIFLIAVCTRVYCHVLDVEPKCSKFDFEEKVLEKMVRLEHSTEIMMERFNDLHEKVENSLKTMKDEFDAMKLRIKEDQDYFKQKLDGKIILKLVLAHLGPELQCLLKVKEDLS